MKANIGISEQNKQAAWFLRAHVMSAREQSEKRSEGKSKKQAATA
jgi:hypothetical protein